MASQESLSDASSVLLLDLCNLNASPTDMCALKSVGVVPYITRRLLEVLVAFAGMDPRLQSEVWNMPEFSDRSDESSVDPAASFKDMRLMRRPWNTRFGVWTLFRLLSYLSSQLAVQQRAMHRSERSGFF
jgi:hypothetical protein